MEPATAKPSGQPTASGEEETQHTMFEKQLDDIYTECKQIMSQHAQELAKQYSEPEMRISFSRDSEIVITFCVELKLTVKADVQTTADVEAQMTGVSICPENVKASISWIKHDIQSKGVEIEIIQKGPVFIKCTCSKLKQFEDLVKYMQSPDLQGRLSKLSAEFRRNTNNIVEISTHFCRQSLHMISKHLSKCSFEVLCSYAEKKREYNIYPAKTQPDTMPLAQSSDEDDLTAEDSDMEAANRSITGTDEHLMQPFNEEKKSTHQGSVVLTFTCTKPESLHKLIEYTKGPLFQQRLNELSETFQRSTNKSVKLSTNFCPKSLDVISHHLRNSSDEDFKEFSDRGRVYNIYGETITPTEETENKITTDSAVCTTIDEKSQDQCDNVLQSSVDVTTTEKQKR